MHIWKIIFGRFISFWGGQKLIGQYVNIGCGVYIYGEILDFRLAKSIIFLREITVILRALDENQ